MSRPLLPPRARIMIVDASPVLRHGLQQLLAGQATCQVVAAAASASEALWLADIHDPTLVLCATRLRGVNGALFAALLKRRRPRARVILIADELDDARLLAAATAGAAAVLTRHSGAAELLEVVGRVQRGERPLVDALLERPTIARGTLCRLYDALERHTPDDAAGGLPVSERELLVLDCLAHGWSTDEAAERLFLNPKTVANYVAGMCVRFAIHNRVQLLRYAMRAGWIDLPGNLLVTRPDESERALPNDVAVATVAAAAPQRTAL